MRVAAREVARVEIDGAEGVALESGVAAREVARVEIGEALYSV